MPEVLRTGQTFCSAQSKPIGPKCFQPEHKKTNRETSFLLFLFFFNAVAFQRFQQALLNQPQFLVQCDATAHLFLFCSLCRAWSAEVLQEEEVSDQLALLERLQHAAGRPALVPDAALPDSGAAVRTTPDLRVLSGPRPAQACHGEPRRRSRRRGGVSGVSGRVTGDDLRLQWD